MIVTGDPEAGQGFGLLKGVTVDQHFSNRGRLPRLLALLHAHPGQFGIGIDESTAVVIQEGEAAVLGAGTVTAARASGSPGSTTPAAAFTWQHRSGSPPRPG